MYEEHAAKEAKIHPNDPPVIDLTDDDDDTSSLPEITYCELANEALNIYTAAEIKRRESDLTRVVWENACDHVNQDKLRRVTAVVTPRIESLLQEQKLVKNIQVQRFGSYLSGTQTADSDIDLHVQFRYATLSTNEHQYDGLLLRQVRQNILDSSRDFLEPGQLIHTKRLNLWKTTHILSRTPIDIVFNNIQGVKTALHLKKLIAATPYSYPLIQLFKIILKKHNLIAGDKQLLTSYSASILVLIYIKNNSPANNLFLHFFQLIKFYAQPGIFHYNLDLDDEKMQILDGLPCINCPYEKRNVAPLLNHTKISSRLQKILCQLRSKKSPF
jgi:predicted nucleotidyltransferase